jgi:NTE family protein
MRIQKKLKWALVLAGGGARGLVHVGVINALNEMGFPAPSLIVGTSMGAIIGGLYACGMGPGELKRFVLEEFDITDYLDSVVFKLSGPVGKIVQTGQILGSLAGKPGIDSGERILNLLERLTKGRAIEDLPIPFRCNAVDIAEGRELVFSSGSLARAIRASMSFPAFFAPLGEGGRCLVDGGLSDNMPVGVAKQAGFNRVLAVSTGHFRALPADSFRTGPKVIFRSFDVILKMAGEKARPKAGLTLYASDKTSVLDFSRKKELIALGERAVRESEQALGAFFRGGPWGWFARKQFRECGIREDSDAETE